MKFPKLRDELLAMLDQDQREVRECSKAFRRSRRSDDTRKLRDEFIRRSQGRVRRVIEILEVIGAPTVENIGTDGSQAVSVLGLHSRLSHMKKILRAFKRSYGKNPDSVYAEAIPSLEDRVLIIEQKEQQFGTQWMLGSDGNFFLPPVADFANMDQRRAVYGLGKSRHPIDLTSGVPTREPFRAYTKERDQRAPTKEEYDDFVYESLD